MHEDPTVVQSGTFRVGLKTATVIGLEEGVGLAVAGLEVNGTVGLEVGLGVGSTVVGFSVVGPL